MVKSASAVLTLLFSLALASPVDLAARFSSAEVIYLTNCQENNNFSQMSYYSDIGQSGNGQIPQSTSKKINGGTDYVKWEGNSVSGYFPDSGETFVSNIQGNGGSLATGAYAGPGHNNEKSWSCYKDNGRRLYGYPDNNGVLYCNAIYYCRPN